MQCSEEFFQGSQLGKESQTARRRRKRSIGVRSFTASESGSWRCADSRWRFRSADSNWLRCSSRRSRSTSARSPALKRGAIHAELLVPVIQVSRAPFFRPLSACRTFTNAVRRLNTRPAPGPDKSIRRWKLILGLVAAQFALVIAFRCRYLTPGFRQYRLNGRQTPSTPRVIERHPRSG